MSNIKVFIKSSTDEKFSIDIMSSATVKELKVEIEKIKGIESELQRLIFSGMMMCVCVSLCVSLY